MLAKSILYRVVVAIAGSEPAGLTFDKHAASVSVVTSGSAYEPPIENPLSNLQIAGNCSVDEQSQHPVAPIGLSGIAHTGHAFCPRAGSYFELHSPLI